MSLHSWLRNLRSALAPGRGQRKYGRRGSLRAATHRPNLEILEDRCVPAFLAPVDYALGSSPSDAKGGDFNGDAVLDLITVHAGDNTVSVLLGNADGTFQPRLTSDTGLDPADGFAQSVAVGDFNDDGKLDLATVNYDYYGANHNDVSILLGNGDGTFTAAVPQTLSSELLPLSIATGDLNADGKLDLVLSAFGYYDMAPNGFVMNVLLGNGDGSFTYPQRYGPYDQSLGTPVLADLNNDGNTDVAVAGSSVSVFLGNGDGTLQAPSNFASYWYHNSVTVGDFNADGNPDLATASDLGAGVLLGNGDGTFQAAQFAAGDSPRSVTAGDVNSDGVLDLVVTNPGSYPSNGAVSVLLGFGDGSFSTPIATATGGSSPHSAVLADFNADGRPDVAVADAGAISVLLNDGNWSFPPPSVSVRDATVTEGHTGTAYAAFTLTLSHATNVDVTVHYDTADISAVAGSDYAAASGDVIIPAGQTSGTFTVAVLGDRLAEPSETFAVNLSAPTNATIGDGQGIGTILDDEPRISINDVTKKEGNGKTTLFTFTITLSAAYDEAVTLNYATANGTATAGSDYETQAGSVTFAPGETTKTITVVVKGDKQKEANETFFVDLSGASSNALIEVWRAIGKILDDDNRL